MKIQKLKAFALLGWLLFSLVSISCQKFRGLSREVARPELFEAGRAFAEVAGVTLTEDGPGEGSRYCLEVDFINKKLRAAFYNENYVKKKPIIEIPLYEDDTYLYAKAKHGGRIFIFAGPSGWETDKKTFIYFSSNRDTIESRSKNAKENDFDNLTGGDDKKFGHEARLAWPVFPVSNENSKRYNTMEYCIKELPDFYKNGQEEYEAYMKEEVEAGKRYIESELKRIEDAEKRGLPIDD
ncbi:hypothetical protein [Leptospira brenneri]|uniref:Lipoprotein n=1 Tax=Leptospira brenneri TaxID=2023182 RepID=A0A2M9Y050_9LEPT|nr:hypothetical protein [Leptospira brenneri]PJZ44776.1 hypothetical protein CH361_14120 [Leptospira brenneri]TGK97020.1 hypothetical protein EHQ30_10655 [Leptospira brenneri]